MFLSGGPRAGAVLPARSPGRRVGPGPRRQGRQAPLPSPPVPAAAADWSPLIALD